MVAGVAATYSTGPDNVFWTTSNICGVEKLTEKERKQLDKLNGDRKILRKQMRLKKFTEIPARLRQQVIDMEQIKVIHRELKDIKLPEKSQEHIELENKEANMDSWITMNFYENIYSGGINFGNLDITLEDLEEAHTKQCIEEQLLTETDPTD